MDARSFCLFRSRCYSNSLCPLSFDQCPPFLFHPSVALFTIMSAPYERDITAHSMLFSASGISQDGQHYDNQSRTSEAFVPKPFQFDQPELPSRNSSESGSPDIHFRPKLESKNSDSSDGSSSSEKRKSRVPVPDYIPVSNSEHSFRCPLTFLLSASNL